MGSAWWESEFGIFIWWFELHRGGAGNFEFWRMRELILLFPDCLVGLVPLGLVHTLHLSFPSPQTYFSHFYLFYFWVISFYIYYWVVGQAWPNGWPSGLQLQGWEFKSQRPSICFYSFCFVILFPFIIYVLLFIFSFISPFIIIIF